MIITPCTCNWGIEGVESLPEHHHYVHPRRASMGQGGVVLASTKWVNEDCINIWVDWKQVARELGRLSGSYNPWAHMDGGW